MRTAYICRRAADAAPRGAARRVRLAPASLLRRTELYGTSVKLRDSGMGDEELLELLAEEIRLDGGITEVRSAIMHCICVARSVCLQLYMSTSCLPI